MFFINPQSTLPAPISIVCVTPLAANNRTVSTQRTGFGTCSNNPSRASAPLLTIAARQLFTSGTSKSRNEVASRSARSRSCAGRINGQ